MQTHWFYTVWPFIGVGGAIVMVAILLLTDTFRGNTTVSRWRDPVWLAWSPDGTRIAFAGGDSGSQEIYVINADGTNAQPVTDIPAAYFTPIWLP